MPRRLWNYGELTTANQMNELTREAAQRFITTAEAEGAYDPTVPPDGGQVRMLLGRITPERVIVPETGLLSSARPITDFRMERYDGANWFDDAILPEPLQIGWQLSALAIDEPVTGTATLTARIIVNRPVGTAGMIVYVTTADGTATAPGDYVAKNREPVAFVQGDTFKDVSFTINASPVTDPLEQFTATIVGATEGTFGSTNDPGFRNNVLTISIGGDTSPITLRLSDTTVTEGGKARFSVTSSRATPNIISGIWSVGPVAALPTQRNAVSGVNYQLPARAGRRWQINAGATSTLFDVETINTATVDPGLYADVTLSDLSSGSSPLATSGNDLTGRLQINDTETATTGVIATVGPTAPASLVLNKASNTWVFFDYNFINRWQQGGTTWYVRFRGTIAIRPGATTYSYTFVYPPADNEPAATAFNTRNGSLSGRVSTVGAVRRADSRFTFTASGRAIVGRFFTNPINCSLNQTVR